MFARTIVSHVDRTPSRTPGDAEIEPDVAAGPMLATAGSPGPARRAR